MNRVPTVALYDSWVERAETQARRLASARDYATLAQLATENQAIAAEMLAVDAGGGLVTRTLSALNDTLALRAIRLAAQHHRLPSASWCWLALGSEGREEQTFATDQDNGIIFAAADATEARALRPLLLACAGEINQALAECGFALCDGGIMAGNPECCLSLDEWRQRFIGWVRTPEPQALLNATIFFDLRALYGEAGLVESLRHTLGVLLQRAEAFMHLMTQNALAAEPPLGILRDFSIKDDQGIDLKKFGARIFVDAARIFAMDCPSSRTTERLRHAVAQGRITVNDAGAAICAFHHLQRMRLQSQQGQLLASQQASNQLAPETLNDFERSMLHEALKQARLLQQRLKITHRIEG